MTMMKKGNVTILASIFAIALVAAGVGAGTMAWFSTTEQTTSTYTMKAATMSMSITAGPYTFEKLVPGKAFGPITIEITNTGSMDINYLGGDLIITDADGNPYSSDAASGVLLANYIEITSLAEYIPNYGWIESIGGTQHYETLVQDGSAPLTLMELAKSYWYPAGSETPLNKKDQFGNWVKSTTDWCTGDGYDIVPKGTPALAFGGTYYMVLKFKLSDGTPNPMQGQSCSFKIVFTGVQQPSQLP
jgi:predicted ribosomally synthesized peptide with SipW-like signal peptide